MKYATFSFSDDDDWTIVVHKWLPDEEPRAIINLVHGMAEHAARYGRLAEALTAKGFAVYAQDLRGHGQTAGTTEKTGFIGKRRGFDSIIEDTHQLTRTIRKEWSKKPIFMMGHSFGSFVVQAFIESYGRDVSGAILSGTTGAVDPLAPLGRIIAGVLVLFRGPAARSPFLDGMTFKGFLDKYDSVRTPKDWISRDTAEVDKYLADPFCGFACSTGFYRDLAGAVITIHKRKNRAQIPRDLPVYVFGGSMDPVGGYGRGLLALASAYRELGIEDVEYNLYEGGRHEMVNEINRDEVTADLIKWLEKHAP